MKKRLLEIFNSHDYQPKNFEELFAFMGLEDSERDDLEKALSELLDEYEVLLSRKKRYILPRTVNIYKGQISIKNPDFGFITSPDFERDFYVSKSGFNGAMDRDVVVFQALGEYNDSDSFKQEAKVIDILKRNLTTLVGELYRKKGRFYLKTRSTDRLVRVVGICDQYIEGMSSKSKSSIMTATPSKARSSKKSDSRMTSALMFWKLRAHSIFRSNFRKKF